MSEPTIEPPVPSHPISFVVTDDLRRSRLTVFFRLLLVIPHLIVVALWAIAALFALLAAWFAALFTGRVPAGLHDFLASYLRYSTRVTAYAYLIADPFPPFGSGGSYPLDVTIAPPQTQGRLSVFFRLLLAIPALALSNVFRSVNQIVTCLGWFYALFTGSMHESLRDLSAWLLRFETQTYGYVLLLTPRYPSLSGTPKV
ncbi:MAG: DUF4389 domain-containing protein [Actinobacteria bacterium]|uniref:Unannotated protein n=1 Tax=freshwater metagenome TaxID=449393 RepID=A0A6J6QF80_9ZZZZ|nr:DUF4389 domain-containing protein [Actinomycetota bacterium]